MWSFLMTLYKGGGFFKSPLNIMWGGGGSSLMMPGTIFTTWLTMSLPANAKSYLLKSPPL